jgi:limonene-1,2-epoxide hydrolase
VAADSEPSDVVRDFCAACADFDIDVVCSYFTDDAVWHPLPHWEPVSGRENLKTFILSFMGPYTGIDIQLRHVVADGPVVLTERVDTMVGPDYNAEIPVMGTFEIRDGKIAVWRDYFDLNQLMSQVPGAEPPSSGEPGE